MSGGSRSSTEAGTVTLQPLSITPLFHCAAALPRSEFALAAEVVEVFTLHHYRT
jgi:hypothetical protein